MNTSISKEIIDTDRLADVLAMYEKCKTALKKVSQDYVSRDEEHELIQQLPNLIKNSMPTEQDKEEAQELVNEISDAEKVLLNWYNQFSNDEDFARMMDNSDLIQKDYFYVSKHLLGQNKTITFKIKSGKRAGERVTYNHDEVVRLNIEHLEKQVSWTKDRKYSSTNYLPEWVKLNP